ncbi:hypothetical protein ACH4GE_18860 [Streptomyces tendae]|uniref:hypothetical protein n=1 Tax=Streptomyces TaxID=1883 RepID=UPI0037963689
MNESTTALLAAGIGAGSALLVGGLAFWAAMRQVRISAKLQREHSFWASRRNTYATHMNKVQECERLFYRALGSVETGRLSIAEVDSILQSVAAFENVHYVMALEIPSGDMNEPYEKVHKNLIDAMVLLTEVSQLLDHGVRGADVDHLTDRIRQAIRDTRSASSDLFVKMRRDLHDEVDANF